MDKKLKVQPLQKEVPLTPKKFTSTDSHATIDGVLASISPTKSKSNFFDGKLTDGDTVMRLVELDKDIRDVKEDLLRRKFL